MDYIIDTSILIEIDNDNEKIISKIDEMADDSSDLFITYFGFCEYFYGHIKKNEKNKAKVIERLGKYKFLDTSKDSAIIFCNMKRELKEKGSEIPVFDLLSSSIAVSNNMAMITADEHFNRIPGLRKIVLEP
ncbi:MAG: type II toxin-antitoxin system VapC family toxin [Nanoarchaeota archaeon]|nr:type II toxin-antitoxin system VapC family toxin [Nanoarchaeota archaeon]MBU1004690.1 type II toxin-antitoxin system VapC family toxin [Nanoarchaeota archaeon]MBU1945373.1 type II toxin-antitoxin system VapC family toxin [Nanoarchaeota archaeon]